MLKPEDLKVFGEIKAQSWKWEEKDPAVNDNVTGEQWDIPGLPLFEFSRKVKNKKLKEKADKFQAFFAGKEIHIDPDPTSKTLKALNALKQSAK